jgi:polar amino acid transport system substrate-binding protein
MLPWSFTVNASTRLTIYAYHSSPPFMVNAETEAGLNYDVIRALALQLGNQYELDLQLITRPELNERLSQDKAAIVLWANPAWFTAQKQPYHWSSPLFIDREIFVSPMDFIGKINQLTDLAGSTLGAIEGYKYPGVDELITQHHVTRFDAKTDKENLTHLLERTVDHIVITRSSFLYYGRQQQFLGKMKIVGQPYPSYKRQILLTHHYTALLPDLERALTALQQQTEWKARLELYGLKSQ